MLEDLYSTDTNGAYFFTNGVNYKAMLAFAIGIFANLPGFFYARRHSTVFDVTSVFKRWRMIVPGLLGSFSVVSRILCCIHSSKHF